MSYFDDLPIGDDWFPEDQVPRGEPGPTPREEVPEVPYCPVRCPRCGAKKPRTNGVQKSGRRYHICQTPTCGQKFVSIEINSTQV